MQFKIDENLHSDAADLLRQHGHEALTVFDQGLRGPKQVEDHNLVVFSTMASPTGLMD